MIENNRVGRDEISIGESRVRIVYLKELKHLAKINQPGEVEYEVKIETYFTDNLMVLKKRETTGYVILKRETARGGWRIRGIGTGP
jgi:hypothetical protein